MPLALQFPASPKWCTCPGATIYFRQIDGEGEALPHCSVCHRLCEINEEMGTCRGCGTHVKLYKASKVERGGVNEW